MKKIFLLVGSLSVAICLSAQANSGRNSTDDLDPSAPNGQHPKKEVDTPHFQTLPAEGSPAGENADKYCAAILGGKIAIIYKGKPIIDNINFTNGNIIFKDGTFIDKNGMKRILKKGECIDKGGNPIY